MIRYAFKKISFFLFCLLGITASAFANYPFTNDTTAVSIDSLTLFNDSTTVSNDTSVVSKTKNDSLQQNAALNIFYGQIIDRFDEDSLKTMTDEELSEWNKSKESTTFCKVSNAFKLDLERKWNDILSYNTTRENEFYISLFSHNLKLSKDNNQPYKTIVYKARILKTLDSLGQWIPAPADSIVSIYIFENDGYVYNLAHNQLVRLHSIPEIDSLPRLFTPRLFSRPISAEELPSINIKNENLYQPYQKAEKLKPIAEPPIRSKLLKILRSNDLDSIPALLESARRIDSTYGIMLLDSTEYFYLALLANDSVSMQYTNPKNPIIDSYVEVDGNYDFNSIFESKCSPYIASYIHGSNIFLFYDIKKQLINPKNSKRLKASISKLKDKEQRAFTRIQILEYYTKYYPFDLEHKNIFNANIDSISNHKLINPLSPFFNFPYVNNKKEKLFYLYFGADYSWLINGAEKTFYNRHQLGLNFFGAGFCKEVFCLDYDVMALFSKKDGESRIENDSIFYRESPDMRISALFQYRFFRTDQFDFRIFASYIWNAYSFKTNESDSTIVYNNIGDFFDWGIGGIATYYFKDLYISPQLFSLALRTKVEYVFLDTPKFNNLHGNSLNVSLSFIFNIILYPSFKDRLQ